MYSVVTTGKRKAVVVAAAALLPICGALLGFWTGSAAGKDVAVSQQSSPVGTHMRLLTTREYIDTVKHYFGPDISINVKFSPLTRTDGLLAAGAAIAGVSDAQAELYQTVASLVSAQVFSPNRRDSLLRCQPKSAKAADDACATQFLERTVTYLYRAPPSKEQLAVLVKKAAEGAEKLNDFYAGLQLTLEGVLLNPNALFVAEEVEPDPDHPGRMRLDAYSYVTRLSLFLWNAAPDGPLLEAAAKGQLNTTKGRTKIVDMMLASPRLEDGMRAFFDDMFGFEDFDNLSKDSATYPYFLGGAASDAREQTLRTVVDHLLTNNRDYRDLYTTRETFVSPNLAVLYGVPTTPGWRRIEFPPDAHRSGILTHVSFLSLHAHPARSSATLRGKALRELLLCQKVPPPPPNVDFSLVANPRSDYKTARERISVHLQNPVCAGCHKITDPMGLTLENFDGAGRFRATEKGTPIDASGSLDGKSFTTVEGLAVALHDSPSLPTCLTRRTMVYAMGNKLSPEVESMLDGMNKAFAASGYRLRPLLRAVATSEAFSTVSDEFQSGQKQASISVP